MLPAGMRRDRAGRNGERVEDLIGTRHTSRPIAPCASVAARDQTSVGCRVDAARYPDINAALTRARKRRVVNHGELTTHESANRWLEGAIQRREMPLSASRVVTSLVEAGRPRPRGERFEQAVPRAEERVP
jgi:hypothetical protein